MPIAVRKVHHFSIESEVQKMARKIKIILEDFRSHSEEGKPCFRVKKLINTTRYQIGDYITETQLEMEAGDGVTFEIVSSK